MLAELYIENLAVIEKASISFSDKFSVFSGETGAGKSILIGGINAILGGRVSKDLVRNGAEKALVTAFFTDIPAQTINLVHESGYTSDDNELILTREIFADGKSTARVNGKITTAAILREIAAVLIDIHGQHDTRMLMDNEMQRSILDNYGNLSCELSRYAEDFKSFQTLSRRIKKLQNEDEVKVQKAALLSEKIKEIDALRLYPGEEDDTERELRVLQNNEELATSLNKVYYTLSGGDDAETSVIEKLHDNCIELSKISEFLPACKELEERIRSAAIELDDIKNELVSFMPTSNDENRLAVLEERLSDLKRVKRKYGMTIDDLISENKKWKSELSDLELSEDMMNELLTERKELGDKVKKAGAVITEKRKKSAELLTTAITRELAYLNMPDVRFIFQIKQDKVTVNGMDSVEMLISVNKGESPKPINKVASGGELSRIMLALKAVLADNDDIPTMIFDEIDAGISGRAAQKVGVKLRDISRKRQVLCVTHLAQIAAMADKHLMIEKSDDGEKTYTQITDLDYEGRKKELARIISGNQNSEISIKNAEELLNQAHNIH